MNTDNLETGALRKVLKHYHIFKNSGSTFEAILKRNYGKTFKSFDTAPGEKPLLQDSLAQIIQNTPTIRAYSSHTTRLPVPEIEGVTLFPVLFVREPLLRTRSVYQFLGKLTLREQVAKRLGRPIGAHLSTETRLAKTCASFPAWLEAMLECDAGRSYLSNSQTRFLSGRYNSRSAPLRTTSAGVRHFDIEQAKENLSSVTCIGRTESFEEDVRRISDLLQRNGVRLELPRIRPKNVTSADFGSPTRERVGAIHSAIGKDLGDRLSAFLEQDMQLWEWVDQRLSQGLT